MRRRAARGRRASVELAALLGLLAGAAPRAAPAADELLARPGGELFQRYCASCHGATGEGDGVLATLLAVPPADLTRIAARRDGRFPDAEVARHEDGRFEVPAHGTREMPVWGRRLGEPIAETAAAEEVACGRILALVEYLASIQRPAAPPPAAE